MQFDHLAQIDVTALWRALEAAAEQVGLGVFVCHLEPGPARILHASPRALRIIGKPADAMVGAAPWQLVSEADQPRIRSLIEQRDATQPLQIQLLAEHADGRKVPLELGAARVQTSSGTLSFGYLRDLSSEQAAFEALRRSEARFRFLVEAAPDGVVILVRGKVVFLNPRAATLLGADNADAALGQPIGSFLPARDAAAAGERIATMLRTGEEMPPSEYGVLAAPDRVVEIKSIICEWENGPAVLAFARDVTARKALDKKLVETDRLNALGTLSAGVAHEINNPLTYAQLSLQRMERTLAKANLSDAVAASLREQLHDVHHGIARVASITSSLRMFARPDESPPGPIDAVSVLERALKMVDNELRHRGELIRQIEEVPFAIGNASRLEQVLVNLLINAMQSLPSDGTGRVEVAVTLRDAAVAIDVTDNGCGIPASVRDRVFDPFFTTKPVGDGMGLGLSVCKTIVESFGGTIELTSTERKGTAVTVRLRSSATPPKPPPEPVVRSAPRRSVLIVDDDELVRKVLEQILSQDHDVSIAESGAAGVEFVAARGFDVILCDMMMPGMDGREVHRRFAALKPGLERRIIFITGGTFELELDRFLVSSGNLCLTKPFRIEHVLDAVAQIT